MTVTSNVSTLDTSASIVSFLLKLIVKSESPVDLVGGQLRPGMTGALFRDFGVSSMFTLLGDSDHEVGGKVSKKLLLSNIPTTMVDNNIIVDLLALKDATGANLFTDFGDLMDYGKTLALNGGVSDGCFPWWDNTALNTGEEGGLAVTLALSDNVTAQMVVDWLAWSTVSGVSRAKVAGLYSTKSLSNFTYADATKDGEMLSILQKFIGSANMTCDKLSDIFAWQSLLSSNVDVSNIKSSNAGCTMSNLVAFFKLASGNSSLNVNDKFLLVVSASNESSSKYVALYIANQLGFTSSEVLSNVDFKSAIFAENVVAKDFDSIFSGDFTNILLVDRLAGGKSRGSTIVLSEMIRRTLSSESLADIVAAIKTLLTASNNSPAYVITGYSLLSQKTANAIALIDTNYTGADLTASELKSLSIIYGLSKLGPQNDGKAVAVFDGSKSFNLNDLITANVDVSSCVTIVELFSKSVHLYRTGSNPSTPSIVFKLTNWSDVSSRLTSGSRAKIIAAIPGITESEKIFLRLSATLNTTNSSATEAVAEMLSASQVFTAGPGNFSNNQLPLTLFVNDCFSSTSKMSSKLPMLLSAIKNGVDGLSSLEVQQAINNAVGGVGEPTALTPLNEQPAIRLASTVTGVNSTAQYFSSYKGQTLAGALMIYLLANRVDPSIVLAIFGTNECSDSQYKMAATMIQTLNSIIVGQVVMVSFFPLLQSIGAGPLNAEWPLGDSRMGNIADVWPFAFFGAFNDYTDLVTAIGGLGSNDTIKLLMSYVKYTSKVDPSTGVITNGVEMVAIPSAWFTNPENFSSSLPEGVIAISPASYDELISDALEGVKTML